MLAMNFAVSSYRQLERLVRAQFAAVSNEPSH
jgi:hypothetical protein